MQVVFAAGHRRLVGHEGTNFEPLVGVLDTVRYSHCVELSLQGGLFLLGRGQPSLQSGQQDSGEERGLVAEECVKSSPVLF